MKRIASIALPVLVLGIATTVLAGPSLDSEEDKTLYAIGVSLGQNLESFDLSERDLELVKAGLTDRLLGRKTKVDADSYGQKILELRKTRMAAVAEKEKKASAGFLEKMAAEPGAVRTDSGLIYIPLKEGAGEMPEAADTVKVHYHGTLRDGTVFDSSVERDRPATFALNRVIPCWTEALQKMKVGGKAKIACPSDIAYGDRGAPPRIRPGAALVFEVELLDVIDEKKSEKKKSE